MLPQYVLPQHGLSRLAYALTRWTFGPWKALLIRSFIRAYGVDLREAEQDDAAAYATFNAFFTRALKPGIRNIDAALDAVVSPVDGIVSQAGRLDGDTLIQAKGRSYSSTVLLGPGGRAGDFADGVFATFYLSPRHYHRVHMPIPGRLEVMTYIPGRLFSVNDATTNQVDQLFARNERITCRFDTRCGPLMVCMVGAIFVAGMETVWHGEVTRARGGQPTQNFYAGRDRALTFDKGVEIARFNMGSTVILLFAKGAVDWESGLVSGVEVKMGQTIGKVLKGRI